MFYIWFSFLFSHLNVIQRGTRTSKQLSLFRFYPNEYGSLMSTGAGCTPLHMYCSALIWSLPLIIELLQDRLTSWWNSTCWCVYFLCFCSPSNKQIHQKSIRWVVILLAAKSPFCQEERLWTVSVLQTYKTSLTHEYWGYVRFPPVQAVSKYFSVCLFSAASA